MVGSLQTALFSLSFASATSSTRSCESSCASDGSKVMRAFAYLSPWCPELDSMYLRMAQADLAAGRDAQHTFMSVGCNRGEDLVAFSQVFDTHGTYNVTAWRSGLRESGMVNVLEACGTEWLARAAHGPTATRYGPAKSPQAYCVEPMPANVALMNETAARLPALHGALSVVASAFGDRDQAGTRLPFPDCPPGFEAGGLGHTNTNIEDAWGLNCTDILVDVESVDSFLQARELSSLDALFIDVEGHDPSVLDGAEEVLARGGVRYLEFEVHNNLAGTAWANRTVGDVTSRLEASGYVCYWIGRNNTVADLSTCHLDLYDSEGIGWSNVACVLESDRWYPIVDAFSQGSLCELSDRPSFGWIPGGFEKDILAATALGRRKENGLNKGGPLQPPQYLA